VTGVRLTRRTMHFDPARSLAELGLRPRPVAESLAEVVNWFRSAGWLGDGSGNPFYEELGRGDSSVGRVS